MVLRKQVREAIRGAPTQEQLAKASAIAARGAAAGARLARAKPGPQTPKKG